MTALFLCGKMERREASFRRMTRFSTPRSVASPKASKALPLRVPGPQIVLHRLDVLLVVVVDDAYEIGLARND